MPETTDHKASHHQSIEQNEELREQDGMKEQSPGWDTEVDNMPHQILLYQDISVFIYAMHIYPFSVKTKTMEGKFIA